MTGTCLIWSDMQRIMKSPRIYLALVIGLFILLRPLRDSFFSNSTGTFAQFISVPFGMSDFSPFAAVFCVVPFADSFCEDYNSGYFSSIVTRIGIKKYSMQRCITVAISGGIVMALIIFITLVLCALLANQPETVESAMFMSGSIWAQMNIIIPYHGSLLILCKTLIGFIFGCLWALTGLLISTIIVNRYVTFIVPFVLYQGLWFVIGYSAFNPVYLLRGDNETIPSLWFILIYQGALILCVGIAACFGIRRRVIV